MRNYPHQPSESNWTQQYGAASTCLLPRAEVTDEAIAAATNRSFLRVNATTALSSAQLAYGLEENTQTVQGFFREALFFYESMERHGVPMSIVDISYALSTALILGDDARAKRLSNLPRHRYTHPEVMAAEIMYSLLEAEMALVRGDREAARKLSESVNAALQDKRTLPGTVREVKPMSALLRACLDADESAWADALKLRNIAFGRKFKQPELQNDAFGAFDLHALGVSRLARRAGIETRIESVYFPLELLETG